MSKKDGHRASLSSRRRSGPKSLMQSRIDITDTDRLSASSSDTEEKAEPPSPPLSQSQLEMPKESSSTPNVPQRQASLDSLISTESPIDVLGPLPSRRSPRLTTNNSLRKKSPKSIDERALSITTSCIPIRTKKSSLPTENAISNAAEEDPSKLGIDCPILMRVEQEKKRLSGSGLREASGVEATAHSLRFQDINGRNISYKLRPSKKKSCATFLQLLVEGESPRKVRRMVYDYAYYSLHDKNIRFSIPSSDAAAVMRSLKVLCKVSMVKLDYLNVASSSSGVLRKVQSSVDFTIGSSTSSEVRTFSTNSLTQLPHQ